MRSPLIWRSAVSLRKHEQDLLKEICWLASRGRWAGYYSSAAPCGKHLFCKDTLVLLVSAAGACPVYVDDLGEGAIYGELAVAHLEDVGGEAAYQLNARSRQDAHGHHFLDFAIVPGRQVRHRALIAWTGVAERAYLVDRVLASLSAAFALGYGLSMWAL